MKMLPLVAPLALTYALPRSREPPPLVMSPDLVVAIDTAAPSQEQWAAAQLAKWLGAMPGAATNCSKGPPHCGPAVVTPSAVGHSPAVYVGASAAQAVGVPHAELHSLGRDAFRCRFTSSSNALVLTGGLNRTDGAEPRGTINAVFEYLRAIGFRFYTPYSADMWGNFDSTKPKPTASFPSCTGLKTVPSFDYRSISIHNLLDPCPAGCSKPTAADTWWVQNHQNGGGDRTGNYISTVIPFEMGGQVMYSNDTCTSSVFTLVPPVTNSHMGAHNLGQFDKHPEWFSLLPTTPTPATSDGRECIKDPSNCVRSWNISSKGVPGQPGLASLCLANPAMRKYMIEHALQKLRWDAENLGGVQLIDLADNDATDDGLCHCAKCVAHRERDRGSLPCASKPAGCGTYGLTAAKYRGAAGLSLEVGSMLAGAIAEEFPDVDVWVQSYHAQLTPPKVTRPANGVKVQFTTLHNNFGQPLTHSSNNVTYDQLIGWTKIMPHGDIVLWDYFTNFGHPMILLPNWFKMVADIKLYASLGVSGIDWEGNAVVATADLHAMRAWVGAQLSWDAKRDGLALIEEFLVNVYSEGAAGYIMQHMKAYTDEVDRQNYYVTPADPPTAGYFTPAVIFTSLTALERAIQNATAASETMPRAKVVTQIKGLQVSPWFLALSNWEALCAYTTTHSLPWPRPLEASRHASLVSFASNVTEYLGATTLKTEAAVLAAMNSSKDLMCA